MRNRADTFGSMAPVHGQSVNAARGLANTAVGLAAAANAQTAQPGSVPAQFTGAGVAANQMAQQSVALTRQTTSCSTECGYER